MNVPKVHKEIMEYIMFEHSADSVKNQIYYKFSSTLNNEYCIITSASDGDKGLTASSCIRNYLGGSLPLDQVVYQEDHAWATQSFLDAAHERICAMAQEWAGKPVGSLSDPFAGIYDDSDPVDFGNPEGMI